MPRNSIVQIGVPPACEHARQSQAVSPSPANSALTSADPSPCNPPPESNPIRNFLFCHRNVKIITSPRPSSARAHPRCPSTIQSSSNYDNDFHLGILALVLSPFAFLDAC